MSRPLDYKDLLKRYIAHVVACDSSLCLTDYCRRISRRIGVNFSKEEWAELQKLDRENEEK